MSNTPPDQPELPKLPDFPSGDAEPTPADPPPANPDPQPFEPEPAPFDPAEVGPGGAAGEPPASPPPTTFSDLDGGSRGGSKAPLILGGLVALLVVGGLVWWVTKGDSGSSPEDTVRDYLTATQDGDCDKLITLVTEEMWSSGGEVKRDEAIEECETEVDSTKDMKLTVEKVKTSSTKGDDATVEAEVEIDGRPTTLEVDLRKVDGKWLIAEM